MAKKKKKELNQHCSYPSKKVKRIEAWDRPIWWCSTCGAIRRGCSRYASKAQKAKSLIWTRPSKPLPTEPLTEQYLYRE